MLWSKTKYDSLSRVYEVESPKIDGTNLTIKSQTFYDGNRVLSVDPSGKKHLSKTDAFGRLTDVWEIKAADPDTVSVSFPNFSNLNAYHTSYDYDALGKLRKVNQGSQSRYFMFDSLGRLLRAKNVEQDANTSLTQKTDPITDNSAWSQEFVYDANGNLKTQTTARNITIENNYDVLNRVTLRTYSDSTPAVSYVYDAAPQGEPTVPYSVGKLVSVTNGVSTTKYTAYNQIGQLLSSKQEIDGQSYPFIYEYNFAGSLLSQTYPSGRKVTNTFDSLGRLATVSSQANQTQTPRIYASGFGYNDKGQPNRMRLGNGLWESVKYNNQFQITELGLGTSSSQANRLKIEYEYGELDENGNLDQTKNNGNVARQKITVPQVGQSNGFTATQSYHYDELNRIKSAVETGNSETWWQQHFRYDRYGNRTVVTEQNRVGQEAFTTSSIVGLNPDVETSTNRIVPKQNSTEQYLFDASGNMTRDDAGNTFTFDAENHQKTYTPVNPQLPSATYHYNSDGKRVKKVVGAEVTIFIYDGAGALAAEYTQNAPVNTNPQTVYTTVDSLGTPRINTNQKGEVVARHDYLPFGDEIVGLGQRLQHQEYVDDNIRQKFTGYEKDKESGLDFAQARYYGNGLGRFTSVDPLMESAKPTLPQSWNRYIYCINNPLIFIDPSGLDWYFSSSEHKYKWFNDNPGEGWEKVGVFAVYAELKGKLGWVALNPYANESKLYETEGAARMQWNLYEFRHNASPLSDAVAPIPKATFQFFAVTGFSGVLAGGTAPGLASGWLFYAKIVGESTLAAQQIGIVPVPFGSNESEDEPTAFAGTISSTKRINPNSVFFSQDSIKANFKDGRSIDTLVEGLKSGEVSPNDPRLTIRLVEHDGKLYTLDNRRLEAFRRAGVDVPYRMATPKEIAREWPRKFRTENGGASIRIRGRIR